MRLILFGMLDLNEKANIPTSPSKKVPFPHFAVAMLLLSQERDQYHPRIDLKRDEDDNNFIMSTENSAQVKEKKEDD